MLKRIQISKNTIMTWLLLHLSIVAWATHPVKISTCVITQENNRLLVKMYFFADDFGAHLKDIYGADFKLDQPSNLTLASIEDYIQKNYSLTINNQTIKLNKQCHTLKDNVFQILFSAKHEKDYLEGQTTLNLKNTLLLEAFNDQTNIVRIDFKGDANYTTLEFSKGNEIKYIKL